MESDLDLLAATLAADKTVTNLDEDDKELVELLRELKSDQLVWQYRLWSFHGSDTKLERFLAKNQL